MTRRQDAEREAARAVARFSPAMFRFFAALFARDLAANFHAVRLFGQAPGGPALDRAAPIVVYANHPSWWDAALFTWLSSSLFADRRCYCPIEARMLERYRFFGRIGAFGVQAGTLAGASTFLTVSERVLGQGGLLWVNAEGRFNDARVRPLDVMPGLARLARRVPAATFVPLAIEYAFWDERRPNVLLGFGEPVAAASFAGAESADVAVRLADGLTAAMDGLARAATARDPKAFRTLLDGRVGINAVYDLWRRVRALRRGRRFSPAHGDNA